MEKRVDPDVVFPTCPCFKSLRTKIEEGSGLITDTAGLVAAFLVGEITTLPFGSFSLTRTQSCADGIIRDSSCFVTVRGRKEYCLVVKTKLPSNEFIDALEVPGVLFLVVSKSGIFFCGLWKNGGDRRGIFSLLEKTRGTNLRGRGIRRISRSVLTLSDLPKEADPNIIWTQFRLDLGRIATVI